MSLVILIFSVALLVGGIGLIANKKGKGEDLYSLSIIVVARNEQQRISSLLDSLGKIDYPRELYEVILIDDSSTDKTLEILESYARERENVRVLKIDEVNKYLPGKKAGLQLGLESSRYEILLLTDADCVVSPHWLRDTVSYWGKDTKMLVGYAPEDYTELLRNANLVKRFIFSLRRFSQIANGAIFAATIVFGNPFSCYGRNIAIDRKTLLKAGGYRQMTDNKAGDDKQVLNLLKSQPGKIKYSALKNVTTSPELERFREQQKRRFGKMGMSSTLNFVLTVIVFGFFIYLPLRVLLTGDYLNLIVFYSSALLVWLINLYKHRERFFIFDLVYLLIYPYYVFYYTILGLKGDWQWKS